jgi:hypothetical protein
MSGEWKSGAGNRGIIRGCIQAGRREVGDRSEAGRRKVGGISLKLALKWGAESGIQIVFKPKYHKNFFRTSHLFSVCKDTKKD